MGKIPIISNNKYLQKAKTIGIFDTVKETIVNTIKNAYETVNKQVQSTLARVTGCISNQNLQYVETVPIPANFAGMEAVETPTRLRYQYFVIETVEQTENGIRVTAEHLWYQLRQDYTNWHGDENTSYSGAAACANIMDNSMSPDTDFLVASDCADTLPGKDMDYRQKNICEAFLDPEKGICKRYGLSLIRDNWMFYCLKAVGYDRGFVVQDKKNLLGVTRTEDASDVVTRIIPFARKSDGEPHYMAGTNYVDSTHVSEYLYPRVFLLDTGLIIGKDGVTAQNVDAKLLEVAQKEYTNNHVDEPKVELDIDFVSLGDTEEYKQYRDLDKVYLYDIITVKDNTRGYNYSAQVVGIEHDVLTGQLLSVKLGSITNSDGVRKIATWQVPSVDGSNIRLQSITVGALADGSVTGTNLQDNIISAGKIIAGSVTTEKLSAGAVTADKIGANEVTAAKLAADVFQAVDAEIQSANIGYAQIKDADIQNLITKDAIADRYFIQKLMVQNLQVIEQTVQNLVVKASNGNYYRLDVNENTGAVTPTQVTVTAGEISAGVTASGRSIIDTDILAADLSATNIKGANALIDRITASRLDVAELFARQATISQLNAVDISSNESLQIQAQNQIDLSIGNISIGGTNWLEKSDAYLDITGPSGNTSFQFAFGDIAGHWSQFRGKQITISFDVELVNATGNGTGVFIQPQFWYSDSTYQNFEIVYALNSTPRTLNTRATKTFTVQDKALDHVAQSGIYIYGLTGGRVKVGRPKLEIGNKPTDWTPAPTELKNSSIDISREGISILTDGVLKIAGQTEGSFLLPNGGMTAMNGDFGNLTAGGTRIIGSGAEAFLLPILCKFTQGAASPPSGHNFLWINASGSSFTSASRSGPTSVGYLPRTFTLNAPDNTLTNGTFTYTLKFGVTNRQGSNPDSVTGTVTATINGVTFSSGSITVRKWETRNLEITVSSTTNLFASSGTLSVSFAQTHSGGGLGLDLDGSTMTLTALKSGTSGTQDVSIKYVP